MSGAAGHPGGARVPTCPHAGTQPGGHPGACPHGKSAMDGSRGYRPGTGPAAQAYEERTGVKAPKIVAWEITRSCNLACAHCRAAAHCKPYPGELTLDECRKVIDDIAAITDPILILTGGEPLMRADIWDIVDYARERGLHPVIGTNGTLIDDECARRIAEHGIPRVSVSLDFPTAEGQDAFRGQQGAFEGTLEGIRNLRAHGVEVQVNSTITKMNNHLVEELHQLALDANAAAFHPFLLVPTGRGEDLVDVELSPEEYEEVLTWAYHKQKTSPMHFKPTDSPQYYRIMHQLAKAEPDGAGAAPGSGHRPQPGPFAGSPIPHSPGASSRVPEPGNAASPPPGHPGHLEAMTRGCLGGISFVFISHVGDVQPCGYFDMQLGNVKERAFEDIWTNSPVFDDLRHYDRLRGKCGACEYRGVCGGCRARALAATGDYLAEEPYCAYIPPAYARDKVLDLIQSGFPVEHDPLAGLSRETELPADTVRQTLVDLRRAGIVRRIGASYASRGLGYVSTLCAMAVADDRLDEVAAMVSAHPGVTHNYSRANRYNLWFTLITPSVEHRQDVLDRIEREAGIPVLSMPALKTYKLRVDFSTDRKLREQMRRDPQACHGGDRVRCASPAMPAVGAAISGDLALEASGPQRAAEPEDDASPAPGPTPAFDRNDPFDVELVRWSQGDVFAQSEGFPFEEGARVVSQRLGKPVTEQQVITRLNQLKETGAIRRFGAIVRHQSMGYSTNAMTAWTIPDDQLDAAGRILAASSSVSHCYSRMAAADWTANLYAMVHATSPDELGLIVFHLHRFLERKDIICGSPQVLSSVKEYKKTSMRYFEE